MLFILGTWYLLPWCTKVVYGVRYAVSVLIRSHLSFRTMLRILTIQAPHVLSEHVQLEMSFVRTILKSHSYLFCAKLQAFIERP